MTKEQYREALYEEVDHLPAEYALKALVSELIDEIWYLKKEVKALKDYNAQKEVYERNAWYGRQ